jgi:hypothetical protein
MWPLLVVVGLTEILKAMARGAAERRDREDRDLIRRQAEAALLWARVRYQKRVLQTTTALVNARAASADPRWVRELERITGGKQP